MDKIYEKAKAGGYNFERIGNPKTVIDRDHAVVLDPEFFQALGKACGWEMAHAGRIVAHKCTRKCVPRWFYTAKRFHEINLTEGWEKAVEYLQSVCV